MKAIILFIAVFIFLFYISSFYSVFAADVVINEVFANPSGSSTEEIEFIELFNKGSGSIDISGWKISDKVKTYIIADTIISAGGFVAFRKSISGIALNNTDEDLTLKDISDEIIDSISYDVTIEDKSWSRAPDGTGEFVNNVDPTEGIANSVPTPTSTPTPSLIPTSINTPTIVPTSTFTPTPTKTPTPSPTSTANTPTLKVSPTSAKTPTPTEGFSSESVLGESLGDFKNIDNSPAPEDQTIQGDEGSANSGIVSKIFISLGVIIFIACGILFFRERIMEYIKQFIHKT